MTSTLRLAWPAWAIALILAGVTLAMILGGSQATSPVPATAQTSNGERYSVLVFSRTTGFRHTAAINAGRTALTEMGIDEDFAVTLSEDQGLFTNHSLRDFDVVVFLNTDGEGILNAAQRTAFERWTQRGGGAVRIHADGNADKAWDWKVDKMGGGMFNNHPPIQEATMEVVDDSHPATANVPAEWTWSDEWYNFDADPRDEVHVLMTVDESTYNGGQHGADHPIAWCSEYDGGRNFYTAIGHADGGATLAWSDDDYLAHITGALEWAAGEEDGDCGEPRGGLPSESSLVKVPIEEDVANPMSLDVADDGRVFWAQMGSTQSTSGPALVRMHDPEAGQSYDIGTLQVQRRNENGLMGIALDPDFDSNNFIYLYYSVPGPFNEMGAHRLSRFDFDPSAGQAGQLVMGSEVVLLEVPHQRQVCCHSSGSVQFGPDGLLYLSTGDDTEHARSDGRSNHDARPCGPGSWNPGDANCSQGQETWAEDARHANDSRRSAGNTADLRGKILRIDPIDSATPSDEPGEGSTYETPDDNLFTSGEYDHLFPDGEYDPDLGFPEIYSMGHRNPFRFGFDPETGWIYQGEVGPDANNNSLAPPPSTGRGPRGYDEVNQIREAGNFGWPYCIADNQAYRPWIWTGTGGSSAGVPGDNNPDWPDSGDPGPQDNSIPYFDCENGPFNHSPLNDGLEIVPPGEEAWIYYPYGASPEFPDIPTGNARAAIGGPVYRYDPDLDSDVKLSQWFDGKLIWGEWTRNLMLATEVDEDDGSYAGTTRLLPNELFRHPHDIELGPDGAIYVIEWGLNFNYGAYGVNADAGIYRVEQRSDHPPVATAQASPTSGSVPLNVQFTGELSDQGGQDPLSYEWDFGDGSPTSDEPNPAHTYTEEGDYEATLTVSDGTVEDTDTVTIRAGVGGDCGAARSDDFGGDELDMDRWSVVRHVPDDLWVEDGSLNIMSSLEDSHGGETGLENIVVQPMPTDGEPWSVTTELTWDPTTNYQNAGLMIYDDDANLIKLGMVWSGGRQIEAWKQTNSSAGNLGFSGNLPGGFPSTFQLRFISSDGDSIDAEYSADGDSWESFASSTDLSGLTEPQVGVYATSSTSGAPQALAQFHSVTVEPERGDCPETCSDEFDGDELDTDRWSFQHPSMENDPYVESGNLVFPLSDYGFDMGRPGPASILGQPMPEGDWSVEAKINAPGLNTDGGTSAYAKVGLIAFQDNATDPNYHWISYQQVRNADGGATADTYFEATAQNGPGSGDWTLGDRVGNAPAATNLPEFWMRITRTGDAIEGFYSLEDPDQGGTWTSVNAGAASALDIEDFMPAGQGPIYVGPYGANGSIETFFDYVRFAPESELCDEEPPGDDTTPPVTSVQLDGEDPVETYNGPVDVTLSATDEVGGGGGDPQTHVVDAVGNTWEPDQVEIAFGDEIEWTFEEDQTNQPHDVWLVPPGGDPDPEGEDIFEVTDGFQPAGSPPVSHALEQQGEWTYICTIHSFFVDGEWQGSMFGFAEVGAPSGGEPSGVAFTEYSIDGGDPVQSDNDGGDDPFVTEFTVTGVGEHTVEYRSVDNADNEEGMQSVEFEIVGDGDNSPPVIESISATPDEGDAPLEVDFSAEASDPDDDELSYSWDFADGGTSDEQNPTHTYTDAGVYEAELTVSDGELETSDSVTVNVHGSEDCTPLRSDDFDGDELDMDRWDVVRPEPDRMSVADGALHLVSAPMDIFEGQTGMPNIVVQDLPGGGEESWSITTEMTWEPTQNFQNAGLIVYGDDDNYVKAGMVWNQGDVEDGRTFELIKELAGSATFPGNASAASVGETFFLRLVSDGMMVTAQFSADGETWEGIGSTDLIGIAEPRIGVYATASTQPDVGEPTASFHSVAITPDELDCPDEGEANLRVVGQPKKRTVGPKKKQTSFRLRATNRGDAPSGTVHLCATAPKKRVKVLGQRCRTFEDINPGQTRQRPVKLRIKPKARGTQTKIKLIARGPDVEKRQAIVRLRVRR